MLEIVCILGSSTKMSVKILAESKSAAVSKPGPEPPQKLTGSAIWDENWWNPPGHCILDVAERFLHSLFLISGEAIKFIDELNELFFGDLGLASREVFKLLIWIWDVVFTHDCLHWFCK